MNKDTMYIDESTVSEIVLLRRLGDAYNRLSKAQRGQMNEEQGAMIMSLNRSIGRIIEQWNEMVVQEMETHGEAIGVVVGRFQIPELHDGHRYILETVRRRHPNFAVVIGVAKEISAKNPLTYNMRHTMISQEFPDAVIMAVEDCPADDTVWSAQVDVAIRKAFPIGSVRLYGSRDSFIPFYSGVFPTTEMDPIEAWSATQIRASVGQVPINDVSFRKGIIFATQQKQGETK